MKKALAICNIIAVFVLGGLFAPLLFICKAKSIDETGTLGVIGGVDRPTSVYMSSDSPIPIFLLFIVTTILICNCIILWNTSSKHSEEKAEK